MVAACGGELRMTGASVIEKRRNTWQEVVSAGGTVASLVAALLMAATPALAQQNGCQAALAQVQQARSQIILNHTNAEQSLVTARDNAMLDCQKQAIGGGAGANAALEQCTKQVSDTFAAATIDLQKAFNGALSQEQIVENDVSQGKSCAWTPEEITQMVATVSQAAAQLGQSAAQIIAAAKGKAAGATTPASSTAGSSGNKPPAAPATPPTSTPPSNKPPTTPKPPASTGTTPPAGGTNPATP
jgi:hypothetical protein